MPNFSPSNLVKAQAIMKDKFPLQEMRSKQSASLAVALKNTDVLIPSHQVLRTREDRTVEANIMARTVRTPGSARAANHTGARGDSFTKALAWNTFSDTFSLSIKQMDNNVFSFDEALANEIRNSAINLHEAIETAGIAYLMTNRSQVSAALKGATFNATTDAIEIAAGSKSQFYQIAKSAMRQNKYKGTFDVIADPLTYINAEFYLNQGNANSVNTGFQFAGLNIVESIELADADYANGCGFIMPEGTFGVLPWIPKQNRMGWGDSEFNNVGMFGSIADPMGTGMDLALSVYAQRADTSASNGNVQDVVLQFELSVDIGWVHAPLSVATESCIFEIAQI